MATRSSDINRVFELLRAEDYNDIPAIASDIIYAGSAVGESTSAGTGRPLQGGDNFLGFAVAQCDNSSGAAAAKNIRVIQKGVVKLAVTSVADEADLGATVYASDDDTFTLASTGNSAIGKVVQHVSGTTCMVAFESVLLRSI